jgi:hypothetical protein
MGTRDVAPLYLLLLWYLYTPDGRNQSLIRGLNIFFVIHLFLHLAYLRHPHNEFKSALSWILIVGAAVAGAIDFVIS